MQFLEKLERLTAKANMAKKSRDAGLPATAISNYLTKRQLPRADTGLSLARSLNVGFEWLFDDAREWPPPAAPLSGTQSLSDSDLIEEVSRRRAGTLKRLLEEVERFEAVDWSAIRKQINGIKPHEALPADVLAAVGRAQSIPDLLIRAQRFDVSTSGPNMGPLFQRLFAVGTNFDFHGVIRRLEGRKDFQAGLVTSRIPWFNILGPPDRGLFELGAAGR
jgi:hypothetical protein